MQPTAVTTDFDHLRLADPAALFDAPGLDGAAIRAALVKALAAARPSADESAAHVRLCRIADAGRALLADRTLLAETIHFTQVAAPDLADTAPIAHIRLIALHRRGDTPATVAEADRVLQAGRLDPAGRKIIWASLRQWNIMGMLPPRVAYLADHWGDLDAAIADPFGAVMPHRNDLRVHFGPAIARLNGIDPADEDYLRRIRWGEDLHAKMVHLRHAFRSIITMPTGQKPAMAGKLALLQQAIDARITGIDMSQVAAHIDVGRSVVMASAHAGISVVHHAGLYPALPFPVSVIAQQTAPAGRAGDFNISTKDASANLEFMKLAKMMRKSPRLVRIFPDGPDGEGLPVSVFGRPGRIGRGAAMLSYLGKAATYFAEAHWTGDGFAFSLRAGPLATDYSDLASFERSFADFYVSCFERIVRGAPEDMMPNGGLWPVVLS